MSDFFNNISESGRKVLFGIIALLLIAVLIFVFSNQSSETEAEGNPSFSAPTSPSPSSPTPPSSVYNESTVERYAPEPQQNSGGTEPNNTSEFIPAQEAVDANRVKESLKFLETKNSPSGLVPETLPDEESLKTLSDISVVAATILEDVRFSPKDRYDALPEFFTMYSTIPGEGFNVESLAGEGAVFTFVGFADVAPNGVVAELESSDKPGDHRFMEINFDGKNWTMLKYYDVHYENEGYHSHE